MMIVVMNVVMYC